MSASISPTSPCRWRATTAVLSLAAHQSRLLTLPITLITGMRMGTRMAGIPTDRHWHTGEHSDPVAMRLRHWSRRDAVHRCTVGLLSRAIQAV
ncbi:hypothetical protein XFF6994_2570008 [Xanthomonas citri pv. fuscans]|nr:hypothetical protein XFF6994_2570008 [Xanthomonas citri pv. fuscans]